MAPDERSPLLSSPDRHEEEREATESSPLLGNEQNGTHDENEQNGASLTQQESNGNASQRSKDTKTKSKRSVPWPSIIAGILLALFISAVLVGGFVVPGAVQEYAEQAASIEPTSLSVESITSDGIKARIQANFRLDGSKVDDDNARRIGKFATGLMRKLETEETVLSVFLPHYENALLGKAVVPPLTINIVDGHNTALDFVTILSPGDAENIRNIANEWLVGNLDTLKLTGSADISLKSGILPLGTHNVVESLVFEANKIPSIPDYKIDHLNFHDVPLGPGGQKAVGANVSIVVHNEYPVSIDVPPLSFDILVANCDAEDPYIDVAEAATDLIEVRPSTDVTVGALGVISQIPESLTKECPGSNLSPLDRFMNRYLHGEPAEVFVQGKTISDSDIPEWLSALLETVVVPINLPGRSFGDIIRNFSATDVDFKLPSPFADPNDPASSPQVSGTIEVFAALPEGLDLDIAVNSLRSDADLFYEGRKLGELNLQEWKDAQSTKVQEGGEDLLKITSRIENVPLKITDNAVFSDLLQKMLFGGGNVVLDVKAAVDVKVGTVLGSITLKGVPAKGKIPVKSFPKDTLNALEPQVDGIRILNTSETGVFIQARVNFSNPTPYTASIPYFSAHVLNNGKPLGEAVVRDISLKLGSNTGNTIHATWDPLTLGGKEAHHNAQKLLSDYLSGENTTLQVVTHEGSFPALPQLGLAFSKLNFTVPTPRMKLPGKGGDHDDTEHLGFIRDATFHLLSSTATFTLASPLDSNTVYLEYINATAFYNHTEPVGQIINEKAFPVTPGLSQTPRLPVHWSLSSIGYSKLKDALGGHLKLDAIAYVTIRIGNWVEKVRYTGHGLGARISL